MYHRRSRTKSSEFLLLVVLSVSIVVLNDSAYVARDRSKMCLVVKVLRSVRVKKCNIKMRTLQYSSFSTVLVSRVLCSSKEFCLL